MKTALFDLDGTLTDSRSGIVASLRAALRELGHAPDPAEDLTWVVGPPMEQIIGRLLAPYGDTRHAEAVALYRRHYAAGGLFDNAVYPGIAAALAAFRAAGFTLFVVTAKRTRFAVPILAHFGLAERFAGIHGTEDGGAFDRKADLLAHVLARHAIDPAQAVMIGDRLHDIEAAHANGLPAIGVGWGYGAAGELRAAGAERIAARPGDLLGLAEGLLQSGRLA